MRLYIARRIIALAITLLVITLITFTLMHMVPGGPWDSDKKLPPETIENLNKRYGLDQPIWQQYGNFLWNALQGDLGPSFINQDRDVTQIILQGLPATLLLGIAAFTISIVFSIPLGIITALRRKSPINYIGMFFIFVLGSTPNFLLGTILVVIFSVTFHLLPAFGWGSLKHLILPAFALGAWPAAYNAAMVRNRIIATMNQEFVLTAYAKGLKPRVILVKHVLRNALIPFLSIMGLQLAALISGSFIIESLFSVPGIGRAFTQAVFARDYGLIMGTTLFYATVVVVLNLVVDLLYVVADPRIRLSK